MAVFGCGLSEGNAAESAPVAVQSPANDPAASVEGARRDLDAIKALRDPSNQQKGALPKLTVPEMHTPTPGAPQPWNPKKSGAAEQHAKKSQNWLVDAMEREARASQARERTSGSSRDSRLWRDRNEKSGASSNTAGDELGERSERTEGALDRDGEAIAASRETRAEREPAHATPEVNNPLTRFLGEWMTPRDYAMLKPALDESLSGRGSELAGTSPAGATLGVSGLSGSDATLSGAGGPGRGREIPRDNPYLQAMQNLPAPTGPALLAGAPNVTSLPAPAPVASPRAEAPAPPIVVPPKSKIPEFAKPAQDEKYFKQLKRF